MPELDAIPRQDLRIPRGATWLAHADHVDPWVGATPVQETTG